MRSFSRQGQRNLALRQYHTCVEALTQVLDVSPMEETLALYHCIRRGETV
jgi:DNA-binding SARP family transcriptional activator